MAWLQWLGPLLQGAGQLKAGTETAAILRAQAEAAEEQGGRDEEAQRREGRQAIGRLAASMSEAGGVDEGVLKQSTVLAELDALNVRYGAQLEAKGLQRSATSISKQTGLLAGAQILTGLSRARTLNRTIADAPAVAVPQPIPKTSGRGF